MIFICRADDPILNHPDVKQIRREEVAVTPFAEARRRYNQERNEAMERIFARLRAMKEKRRSPMTEEQKGKILEEFMTYRGERLDEEVTNMLGKYLDKERPGVPVFDWHGQKPPEDDEVLRQYVMSVAMMAPQSVDVLWRRRDDTRYVGLRDKETREEKWCQLKLCPAVLEPQPRQALDLLLREEEEAFIGFFSDTFERAAVKHLLREEEADEQGS